VKILIAANLNSVHTIKWVKALSEKGIELILFCLTNYDKNKYNKINNIKIYSTNNKNKIHKSENKFKKLKFIFALPMLKKIIKTEKPDIIHAHYASSYGFICSLTGFKPLIVSVWGSDIYTFPKTSFLAKKIIKFTLKKATRIFSTSNDMAKETNLYTTKNIDITPFGIDVSSFKKSNKKSLFKPDDIVIGTIKNLEPVAGIDILIKTFYKLKQSQLKYPIKLLIVGDGSQKENLITLCEKLNIYDDVIFTGSVNYSQINNYLNEIDIYVAPSLAESFGVAVLEASACELPVVVTNVGGLPEVVIHEQTGFIVEKSNINQMYEAIYKLINDKNLRIHLGKNGKAFIEKQYPWHDNVNKVINIYNELLNNK